MLNRDQVRQQLAEFIKFPVSSVTDDKKLTELVADSFVLIELMLTLQEDLNIELVQEDLENIYRVSDLLDLILLKSITDDTLPAN